MTVFFFSNFALVFSASSKMSPNPLWSFFHHGEKQNTSNYEAYCKGCVHHYVTEAKLQDQSDDSELDAAASVVKEKSQFDAGAGIISIIYIC